MAYNKRIIFPYNSSSIELSSDFVIISSSIADEALAGEIKIYGNSDIISSSAKLYFNESGSTNNFGKLIATSSLLYPSYSNATTSSIGVSTTNIPTAIRELKNNNSYNISVKSFSPKKVVFSNQISTAHFQGITFSGASIATYTSASVDVTVFRFLSSGNLNVLKSGVKAEILAVGGGGGGCGYAGGGGGGEVAYVHNATLPTGLFNIEVGAGGAGSLVNGGNAKGGDGNVTTLFGETIRVGGGGQGSDDTAGVGVNVSNGGGGGSRTSGDIGTVGTNVSIPFTRYGGRTGGTGVDGTTVNHSYGGGGGAGANENGINCAGQTSPGGRGGNGVQVGTIYNGSNNYYWGGGGGASAYYIYGGGNGGAGGGGNGTGPGGNAAVGTGGLNNGTFRTNTNSGDGGVNTGGGAGSGGGTNGSPTIPANGGSGIVLVKVLTSDIS